MQKGIVGQKLLQQSNLTEHERLTFTSWPSIQQIFRNFPRKHECHHHGDKFGKIKWTTDMKIIRNCDESVKMIAILPLAQINRFGFRPHWL